MTALAFSHASNTSTPPPPGLRLAVGRANGDIEVWNPNHNWCHELTLPGARGRAIEGLVWSHADGENPRLFSIGGSTYVTEWDLSTLRPRSNYDCNAGVVWCVDANAAGTRLAVGCDDGSVVVVDISGGKGVMEHDMVCQRQDLRVLGLRWYGDDMLVGGCADGKVRCWSAKSETRGRLVSLMKVDKAKHESTLVWSVVAMPSRGQFATGDSTGAVKVWDAATSTLVLGFAVHDADVLTLAKDSGDRLYSAGIDRKIHQFLWLAAKKPRWIHNGSRLLHLNDVRALAVYDSPSESMVVSGGVERAVIVQSGETFASGPYRKITMDQQIANIAVCGPSRLVALFQDQTVKLWRVGDKHKLVARLSLADDDNVTCVSVGDAVDGVCYLAVSTINSVKVFLLHDTETKLGVRKIRDSNFDKVIGGAKSVVVYRHSHLLVHTPEDELYRFTVGDTIELDDEVETVAEPKSAVAAGFDHCNAIKKLCLTADTKHVVVARFNNCVEVLPMGKRAGRVLTRFSAPIHLMEVVGNTSVVVLTEDNTLYELHLDAKAKLLTEWSQRNSESMPPAFLRLDDKPQGMFVHGTRVWVYGSQWLAFFDLALDLEPRAKAKKRARDGAVRDDVGDYDGSETGSKRAFWITHKYRPILKVAQWGDDIAVVEREAFALPTSAAFEAPRLRV